MSVHPCGEAAEILENFTYLVSVVHSSRESCQDSLKVDWPGLTVYGQLQHDYLALSLSAEKDKDPNLLVACALSYTRAVRRGH